MQDKRKILSIEKALGFKWAHGLSRKRKESCEVPVVKALLDEIEPLKLKFVHHLPSQLRAAPDFAQRCEELFLKYGPRLWPSPPVDTSDWLVDAAENDWNGRYPVNLSYDVEKQRDVLRRHFRDLVFEKCVRYHENWKQKQRRERDGATLETRQGKSERPPKSAVDTSQWDIYSVDDDSDSAPPPLRNNAAHRRRPGSDTPAAIQSQSHFAAPVAPMVPTAEGTLRSPSTGKRSRREDDSTMSLVADQESLGNVSGYRHPPFAKAARSYGSFKTTAPYSAHDGRRYDGVEFPDMTGAKHSRSGEFANEDRSGKRIKLTKAGETERLPFDGLVKVKLDPNKLAAIIRRKPNHPSHARTGSKRPVSYSTEFEDGSRRTETSNAEGPTPFSHLGISSDRDRRIDNVPFSRPKPASVSNPEDEPTFDPTEPDERRPIRWNAMNRVPSTSKSTNTADSTSTVNLDHLPKSHRNKTATQTTTNIEDVLQSTEGEASGDDSELHEGVNSAPQDDRVAFHDGACVSNASHAHSAVSIARAPLGHTGVRAPQPTQSSHPQSPSGRVDLVGTAQPANVALSGRVIERNNLQPWSEAGSPIGRKAFSSIPTQQAHARPKASSLDFAEHHAHLGEPAPWDGLEAGNANPVQPAFDFPKAGFTPPASVPREEEAVRPQSQAGSQSATKYEPSSALERAKTTVHWESDTEFPSVIALRDCKTHQDFFAQLRRRQPEGFESRKIKAVQVKLTNAEAAGIAESPNCRIEADDDEAGFEYLIDALGECTANVRPKLKITILFWD